MRKSRIKRTLLQNGTVDGAAHAVVVCAYPNTARCAPRRRGPTLNATSTKRGHEAEPAIRICNKIYIPTLSTRLQCKIARKALKLVEQKHFTYGIVVEKRADRSNFLLTNLRYAYCMLKFEAQTQ